MFLKKERKYLIFMIIIVLNFSFSSKLIEVEATTENIIPVADSFVSSADPNSNYGGDSYIEVSRSTNSFVGTQLGYLKFSIGDLGGDILSAKLKLYTSLVSETHSVGIHQVSSSSWDELSITYNNRPTYGDSIGSQLVAYSSTWYSWEINIEENTIITFAIIVEDIHDTTWLWFHSKDQSYSFLDEYRPLIEIETDEILSSNVIIGILFIAGVIGLISFYFYKRTKRNTLETKPRFHYDNRNEFGNRNEVDNILKAKFCIQCGEALSGLFCSNCGKKIEDDIK